MAKSLGQKLMDSLLSLHAAFLNQAERIVRKQRENLRKLADDITADIAKRFPYGMAPKSKYQVEQAIVSIQEAQTGTILAYGRGVRDDGTMAARKLANDVFGVFAETAGLPTFAARKALSAAQVRQLAKDDILGDTASQWFKESAVTNATKVARVLRTSYAEGSGFDVINRRLRDIGGTRDTQLESLARTVVQGISNNATQELYGRNQDAIDGLQWVATLDDVTCLECGPLDGRIYLYRGSPSVDEMPSLPLHPNCRCTAVPWIEGLSEDPPTWEEWLARQDAATQKDVLGATRAKLYRDGLIHASDLRGRAGATRKVSELVRLAEKRKAA